MKKWIYIAYHNANGVWCEWEIKLIDPRWLADHMNQYVKFSGAVTFGVAYAISQTTGKPIFSTKLQEVGLPF